MRSILVLAAALASLAATAPAADHNQLERGLPLRVESAYPIALGGRELQLTTQYERTDASEDRLRLVPRLELGLLANTELTLASELLFGEADDRGSGDVHLEALYNFNQESLRLPALALEVGLDVPTGERSRGLDTTVGVLATKTIRDATLDQLHANVSWTRNFEARGDERDHLYEVVLGYSRPLTADLLFVADVSRRWEIEEHKESNLIGTGVRFQLDPLKVLSAGIALGIGDESPDVVLTVGFQLEF
jgi:hypothetical protein